MNNLVSFKPYIDSTISFFIQQLDKRFVKASEVCNLGAWLQMFAFDVMGEITFSRRLGFLESGEDVSGLMAHIEEYFNKTSPVRILTSCALQNIRVFLSTLLITIDSTAQITQMPWVDSLWAKNPLMQRFKSVRINPIVKFAVEQAKERQQTSELPDSSIGARSTGALNDRDFLSRFLEALEKDKSIPPWSVSPQGFPL